MSEEEKQELADSRKKRHPLHRVPILGTKDPYLLGAFMLFALTAGILLYMWSQMQNQVQEQRETNINLSEEVARLKESSGDTVSAAPSGDVLSIQNIAPENVQQSQPAKKRKASSEAEHDKILATVAHSKKDPVNPEADVIRIYTDVSANKEEQRALVYWPTGRGEAIKDALIELIKTGNGNWRLLSPQGN
jgi:hypothetical protein